MDLHYFALGKRLEDGKMSVGLGGKLLGLLPCLLDHWDWLDDPWRRLTCLESTNHPILPSAGLTNSTEHLSKFWKGTYLKLPLRHSTGSLIQPDKSVNQPALTWAIFLVIVLDLKSALILLDLYGNKRVAIAWQGLSLMGSPFEWKVFGTERNGARYGMQLIV